MSVRHFNDIPAEVAEGNFPWEMYEDGWNGKSLKQNKRVKTRSNKDKVYSHENYAVHMYNRMSGKKNYVDAVSKELRKDSLVSITDFTPINDDQLLATINNGANNIIIDLNKEQRFFSTLAIGDTLLDKHSFNECIKNTDIKQKILSMNLVAKVGTDIEKASIWDGYVAKLTNEMKEQVTKNSKAYIASIISTNRGGFVVEVSDTIKAFMPGSMAAANRVTDYEAMVGTKLEVMVESYDPAIGFVVSRKKFLRTILPIKINNMLEELKQNQDTVYTGRITGATQFGVFVELDEYITGMLHKSLVSDDLRDAMRDGSIAAGSEIKVYVHKIENNRVILSDVPSTERDAVMARREAEDNEEKAAKAEQKKGEVAV